jgi:uncharacterized repeat protein (TIGR03803 family)
MKFIKSIFPVLMLAMFAAGQATAQTYTNLHSFASSTDGANPYAGLILSGNTLYGTANAGANAGNGAVFAVNTDGTGFTNLHSFAQSDGINPYGGLVLSGNTLYGTANQGGSHSVGTVFAINTDGTSFTNLHSFTSISDGANPYSGLILSGSTLYGTAEQGGSHSAGTVFAINTDGTGFTNLYSFTGGSDGANPYGGLVLSGNTLYGMTSTGGSAGNGNVFSVTTNGTGFANLHSFTGVSDGASPHAGLIIFGNTLYGTTSQGGSASDGVIFAITTTGTGFTNLHNFTGVSDGYSPNALILSSNFLYGTTSHGGSAGNGVIFVATTNGTVFTNFYNFTALASGKNSDGSAPRAGLISSGNILYGTASGGGGSGNGAVFALNLNSSTSTPTNPIPLTIQLAGNAVVLSWTNSTFALQSAPAVTGTYTNVSSATTPYTNPISGAQQFFRLIHP